MLIFKLILCADALKALNSGSCAGLASPGPMHTYSMSIVENLDRR